MSGGRVNQLLENNANFAKTWSAPPNMTQLRPMMDDPVLVLTCMDPRVVPEQFLGPNSFVAVFRNAGGRASPDVVRTIATLQSLAYKVKKANVMVIHHTDCGMTHLTDDVIKHDLHERDVHGGDGLDYGCFKTEDLEKSIKDDVATLKTDALLKDVNIRGFVLDTDSAVLREI